MTNPVSATVDFKVPFHDVDAAGIIWHGRYFKYFELARTELLDQIGYGHQAMADSGYVWPVVDTKARFLRPAGYDECLQVEATLVDWDYRLQIEYRIRDKDRQVITRATTTHVPVVEQTREMVLGVPDFVVALIEAAVAAEAPS